METWTFFANVYHHKTAKELFFRTQELGDAGGLLHEWSRRQIRTF
jgi:hypothetical protein